jgi:hypothetical protein
VVTPSFAAPVSVAPATPGTGQVLQHVADSAASGDAYHVDQETMAHVIIHNMLPENSQHLSRPIARMVVAVLTELNKMRKM